MNVLYVTANVLGDEGANAAEIFPKLAVASSRIKKCFVADYKENGNYIENEHGAIYQPMRKHLSIIFSSLLNGVALARISKREYVDVIHVFYRQRNIPLVVFLRIALFLFWCRTVILVDHRSVNLSLGFESNFKKFANFLMQIFSHHLAGNPLAVETNHWWIFKKSHVIDLGYDVLPSIEKGKKAVSKKSHVWFVGSIAPRNRKSEFLISVFEHLQERVGANTNLEIHVAGSAREDQTIALKDIPIVKFHGKVSRLELYDLMSQKPGVGIAFMNKEFHEYAPSLKFVEYAVMGYSIVAADTIGLRTQGKRMKIDNLVYLKENEKEWVDAILVASVSWKPSAKWKDAPLWSYASIFERQVNSIYASIRR